MNCQSATELLPWLMNGTLRSAEEQLVREHLDLCPDCRRELSETSFAWSLHSQHVPAGALVEMGYGRQPEVDHALYERHLAACADCAEQLALVRESRRLENEVENEDESAARVVPLKAGGVVWWRRVPAWQYGAVAACLLVLVAAGVWLRSRQQTALPGQEMVPRERLAALEAENERLRRAEARLNEQQNLRDSEVARLREEINEARERNRRQQEQLDRELARRRMEGRAAPQINILALDVYPVGLTRRSEGAEAGNELVIPQGIRAVTLILNSQAESDFKSYRIEIVNARGGIVWRARGLARNATNDYTINIPASLLPPGDYTINVYGDVEGVRTKVESYRISVRRV